MKASNFLIKQRQIVSALFTLQQLSGGHPPWVGARHGEQALSYGATGRPPLQKYD
jgi:hypothetical protein